MALKSKLFLIILFFSSDLVCSGNSDKEIENCFKKALQVVSPCDCVFSCFGCDAKTCAAGVVCCCVFCGKLEFKRDPGQRRGAPRSLLQFETKR